MDQFNGEPKVNRKTALNDEFVLLVLGSPPRFHSRDGRMGRTSI
ncbi:hypothetical protein [Streptomyces sp. NPDC050355]|uniref:Uncharacterized protein n=1 Tax=Streptomyces sirii TaxID=3127701 RepID=A0ABZ2QFR8_9ACTN